MFIITFCASFATNGDANDSTPTDNKKNKKNKKKTCQMQNRLINRQHQIVRPAMMRDDARCNTSYSASTISTDDDDVVVVGGGGGGGTDVATIDSDDEFVIDVAPPFNAIYERKIAKRLQTNDERSNYVEQ